MFQANDLILIKCFDSKQPFYGDLIRVVKPPQCLEVGQEMTVEHRGKQHRVTLLATKGGGIGWKVTAPVVVAHSHEEAPVPAFMRPLVGIAVLVMKEGKLLLGKRRGSHGAGEYASPGGHLEHLESFQTCATREVMEETGIEIGPLRFLRVLNVTQYMPKHYVDLAFVTEWKAGEPEVREPDKVERWDWYPIDDLPSPLFAMLPSAIAILRDGIGRSCQDVP